MPKYLVIVESPAKAKTIKKYLGANYEVLASNGHVRDLPKSQLGVDVENNFEPKYITIRGKGDLLAKLRKEVKKAEKVFLATDPDREGEAISWHLSKSLKLEENQVNRITFNEITKNAIKSSIKNPRSLDMDLVNAQQVRRILDRMVGYKISPLLWAKVKRGLSAGRVQSVALRIIADREEEINAFVAEEYWSLDAHLQMTGEKKELVAKFLGDKKGKIEIKSEEQVNKIIGELENAKYEVVDIKKSERTKKPPVPFITSTLQQEASKQLNFSTQKTMRIAQQLYEGVEVIGKGMIGLISYLRTDSTRISDEANAQVRQFIVENYGEKFELTSENTKVAEKKIQDAHEAIRPTDSYLTPTMLKESLSREQFRLYQLIWKRFVASRMQSAKYETIGVKIDGNGYRFGISTSKIIFEGFMSVYNDDENDKEQNGFIKNIDENTEFTLLELDKKQHFTQPPAHYTESSLVKAMEELGIGRPSTYSPTITTIIQRRYIAKENKNLYITELGEIVNSIMKKSFTSIVDVNFTANLESLLDKVGEGVVNWKTVVVNFYPDLDLAVKNAEKELEQIKIEDEVTEEICENCGKNMVIKYGPHGRFLACPGFPDCRTTKPYFEKIGVNCPKCNKEIVLKKTKKGRKFYGCENNPECDFMSWQKPVNKPCPKCGKMMLEKGNKVCCEDEKCGFYETK